MAQQFTFNQNHGSRGTSVVVVRATSNGHIRMNDTLNGANVIGETVVDMTIADIAWSTPSGVYWSVKRGDHEMWRAHGNGHLNCADNQMRLESNSMHMTSNCVFELSGSGNASILIKLHKRSGA